MGLDGVLLIGLIKISNRTIAPQPQKEQTPSWIELRNGFQGRENSLDESVSSKSRAHAQRSKAKTSDRLYNLLHSSIPKMIGSERPCSPGQLCSEEDSDYVGDGTGAYFQRAMEISRFSDKVWRKIRSEVYYKRDWIRKGIQGSVKSRILLSPKGKLLTHFIDELSGPRELQAHIIGALRRALEDDFLSPALPRPTIFHLFFIFRIGHEIPDTQHTLNSLVFNIVSPPPGDELQMVFINPLAALDTSIGSSMNPLRRDQGHTLNTGIHLPSKFELTKNVEPEDFDKTVERYEKACLQHLNRYGCYKANSEYDKAGLLSEATRIYTQACARGLKEFCREF